MVSQISTTVANIITTYKPQTPKNIISRDGNSIRTLKSKTPNLKPKIPTSVKTFSLLAMWLCSFGVQGEEKDTQEVVEVVKPRREMQLEY